MFNAVKLVNRRNDQLAEPGVIVVLGRVLALNRVQPKTEPAEMVLRQTRISLSLERGGRVLDDILKGMKTVGGEPRLMVRGHSLSLAKAFVRKVHLEREPAGRRCHRQSNTFFQLLDRIQRAIRQGSWRGERRGDRGQRHRGGDGEREG